MSETDLVRSILQWLELHGIFAWRNNTGAFRGEYKGKRRFVRFGEPGSPDIIGVLPDGRFVGIECKAGIRKPAVDQLFFIDRVNDRCGLAFIARSIDDVERTLKVEGYLL